MLTFHGEINTDELALIIEQLAREVGRMRESGSLSVQDVQQAASSLTRAQLVLNELVRVELRDRGVREDTAEQFVALENRIRMLRDDIYQVVRNRRSSPLQGA